MRIERREAAVGGCRHRAKRAERRKGKMPSCIVKGCNFSWKKKDPNIILHSFPGELDSIKAWLLAAAQATKQEFENIDELCKKILIGKPKGLYRMCSQHFSMDCYYQRGMQISLKREALPTIFPDKETIKLKALRPKTYKPRNKNVPLSDPTLANMGRGGIPTSVVMGLPLRVIKLEQDYPVPLSNPCSIAGHGYYIPDRDDYSPRKADQNSGSAEILPPPKKTKTLGTNTEYFPGQRHKATLTDGNTVIRHKEVQIRETSKDDQKSCNCRQEKESRATSSSGLSQSKVIVVTPEVHTPKGRYFEVPQCCPSVTSLDLNVNSVSETPRRSTEHVDVGCSNLCPEVKEEPLGIPISCVPNTKLKSNSIQGSNYSSIKQEYETNKEQLEELSIKHEDTHTFRVEIPGTSGTLDSSSEKKYIVFDSCLNKLLIQCRCLGDSSCNGTIVYLQKFFVGSRVSVKAECSNGHRFHMWDSQP